MEILIIIRDLLKILTFISGFIAVFGTWFFYIKVFTLLGINEKSIELIRGRSTFTKDNIAKAENQKFKQAYKYYRLGSNTMIFGYIILGLSIISFTILSMYLKRNPYG